jgi:hypothetical protein
MVLAFCPWIVSSQYFSSLQLVYSTVFHQTGELFGVKNYGVILGLIRISVSLVSFAQGPLVAWAEKANDDFGPNMVFAICNAATLSRFLALDSSKDEARRGKTALPSEATVLLVSKPKGRDIPRRYSVAYLQT